jgi:hypothetical protein
MHTRTHNPQYSLFLSFSLTHKLTREREREREERVMVVAAASVVGGVQIAARERG